MSLSYQMSHEVAYYECDVNQTMTVSAMVAVAIQASEKQSNALGRGVDFVHQFGLTWIITDYQLFIERLPRVGETIIFKTQATSYNRFFCYRNFWLIDQAGNEIVRIETVFALMDQTTRKLSRVVEEIIAPYQCEKSTKIKRSPAFSDLESVEKEYYPIQFFEIDENQHVNNAVYFNWLMSPLGFDFLTTYQPTNLHVRFEKEVLYDEKVASCYEVVFLAEKAQTKHEVIVNNQVVCRGEITWQKKKEVL